MDLPHEMTATLMCQKMHWTYDEFLDQPTWLIDSIIAEMTAEAKEHTPKK